VLDPSLPPNASEPLDEAERLLLDAMRPEVEFGSAELDGLCMARPELAGALRRVFASFAAAREALHGLTITQPAPTGPIAGRFRLLGEIGRGGMSIVLSAWDERMRRKVALKCVRAAASPDAAPDVMLERRRARLVHEAQVLAQLEHPGIVPVHDVVRDDQGEVYVAMQHVRGDDLREIYRRQREGDPDWSLARVIGSLQRAFEAVAHAHGKGVLHRDLKPANVMVGSFGEIFVMDWGLARTGARKVERDLTATPEIRGTSTSGAPGDSASIVVTDRDGSSPDSSSALYTQEGEVLGTPNYMSPEQASGRLDAIDARADVYGAGAMLYELLAGRAPYANEDESRSSAEILAELRAGSPASIARIAPAAPAELVAIVERAMAREREYRYPTMRALADDLRAYLEGRVVRAHRTGAWIEARKWMSRHKAVVAVLGVLLATLVVAGVTFAVLYKESQHRLERLQVAQIDSQRRINALRGPAFAGTPAPSFFDDFDDERLHRRWIATERPNLVYLRDGKLVIRSEPEAQRLTGVGLDTHVCVLQGDFDVRVAFRLEGFDVPDVPRGSRIACLQIGSISNGSIFAAIQREASDEPEAGFEQSYRCYSAATADGMLPEHSTESDDREGIFRVTRQGEEAVAYFWRDGWQELFRGPAPRDPAWLYLYARNWYARQPMDFVVESVDLIASAEVRRDDVGAIEDGFESGELDPRYARSDRAGISAAVNGRLYLETFPGVAGQAELSLDRTRWRIGGDFELEVDYELVSFPAPEDGSASRVSVQAVSADGTDFASVLLEATSAGRSVHGRYHREDNSRPLAGKTGRVRIEREGKTLRAGLVGPKGFEVLVERPHVSAQLEMGFALIVESPAASGGVVAAFDNLRLSSLSPR